MVIASVNVVIESHKVLRIKWDTRPTQVERSAYSSFHSGYDELILLPTTVTTYSVSQKK